MNTLSHAVHPPRPPALRGLIGLPALLGVLSCAAGCLEPLGRPSPFAPSRDAALNVWIVEDTRSVAANSGSVPQNEVYSAARQAVTFDAAVNETVAFQIVLNTPAPPAGPFSVHVTDLRGPDGVIEARTAVAIFQAHFVPISRYRSWYPQHTRQDTTPRGFADALVPWEAPRGGGPLTLDNTSNRVIWVDVHIPLTATPGDYTGRVELSDVGRRAFGAAAPSLAFGCELRVRVLPVAIPSERSLPALCRVDPGDLFAEHLRWQRRGGSADVRLLPDEPSHQSAIRLLHNTMELFQSHRTNPMLWGSYPKYQPTGERSLELDWDKYDRLVGGWIDGSAFADGVGLARWPIPASQRHPDAEHEGGFDAPSYARLLAAYLDACRKHFEQRGWLDKAFVRIDPPAELSGAALARVQRIGGIVRQSETGLKLVAHLPAASLRPLGWFNAPQADLPDVSIWAPPAMWYEPQAAARERSLGRQTWFLPDDPPYSGSLAIEAPAADSRMLAWQAFRYGAEALWIEHAADFGRGPYEPDQPPAGPHDALIYPGTRFGLVETPIASARLKRLRRGLQDYELLRLLDAHGKSLLAQQIAQQVVRYAHTDAALNHLLDTREPGWSSDAAVWELARELLVQELAGTFDPRQTEASGQIADLARWSSLMNQAPRLLPLVDGVRLSAGSGGRMQAHAYVSVANATTRAADGRWRIAAPPAGWTQRPAAPLRVAPGARLLDSLTIDLEGLAFNPDGVLPLDLQFETTAHGVFAVPARLAVALCPFVEDPPLIDGDLSDWIVPSNNVAADFRLCRGRRIAPLGGRENVPAAGTRAMFCHDGRFLYVSVECAVPEGESPRWLADNDVPIDGIVPWGQDVVEVLINPLNALEGSSGDIYALQIKPSGFLSASRGCRTDPPMGQSEPWPCGAELRVEGGGLETSRGLETAPTGTGGRGLETAPTGGDGRRGLETAPTATATRSGRTGGWTLELRLPLASLGPGASASGVVWGVNVTRLDARRGEYSSWSAARRHCYAPQTMGNLIVLSP